MAKRIQSPSSINTYKSCPRRYYYQYIAGLPTKDNIYSVKGKLAHTILEKFFDIDIKHFSNEDYKKELSYYMKNLFNACWLKSLEHFESVGATEQEMTSAKQEIAEMLANWLQSFFEKVDKEGDDIKAAFKKLKPIEREVEYISRNHLVKGFIDVVEDNDGEIKILDYKTSKKSDLTPEYKLQLAIYALLYKEKHGKIPKKLGIWFLREKEVVINVEPGIIDDAVKEIKDIHFKTETNDIENYPRKTSPLCKWSNGQCDFYEHCFKNK
ncbi:PD-(D/E)XK nuclease family protein [Candidatus Woesearchaeota archaeon]|nr:PD-(D/E)XK nuclease family protein [Candidatus Woesearchaeota archaeon]